jgi:PAS domain S-box-containing protein
MMRSEVTDNASGRYAESKRFFPGVTAQGSFGMQIILTFVVGFFFLITAFSVYQVRTESVYLYQDSTDETISLAESLAASSRSWVLANDVAGLQEVVSSFQSHPGLRYAMIISPSGRVLAHSDESKIGQFVSDEQSLALIRSPPLRRIMVDTDSLIGIAVPVIVNNQLVAWARAGQGRDAIAGNLRTMMWHSALFVLMAVILSLLAAFLIANRLGRRIGYLMRVAEAVQAGDYATRANISGVDEIARLANSLNHMLDVLAGEEEQLRAASLYTRSLIEASLDPLVTISMAGKITDVNQATEQVTGRNRAELIGTDFSDYFTEPEKAKAGYQQVFAKGFVTDYPLALRHRDGHVVDVLYNASVYRNELGEVLGVFAAARDISVSKKAEEELRRVNERFSLAARAAGLGVWDWNIRENRLLWDDGMYQLYGVRREEFDGAYEAWLKGVHPDDREFCDEISRQAQRGEREYDTAFRVIWPDGSIHYLKAYGQLVRDADGSPLRMTGVNYDITELKRMESRLSQRVDEFRRLAENSPDVIVRYDRQGRRMYVNPEFERVNHVTAQQVLGKTPVEFASELKPMADVFTEKLMAAMESAEPVKVDLSWSREGKTICWFVRVVPELDENGTVISALTIWNDISDRKRVEEALLESEERFRSLVEQSPLSIQMLSPDGVTLQVNRAFEVLWGITLEDLKGYNLLTDQQLVRLGLMPYIQSGFSGEASSIPAAEYDTHNSFGVGGKKYVQANIYPVKDKAGKICQVILIHEDITERTKAEAAFRESESRLRTLVQTIPDLIWLKDTEGLYLFCNPAFELFLGKKEADIVGKTDYDFVDRELADFFQANDRAAIACDKPSINNEWITFASDNHRALMQTTKIPMRAADGQLIGVLGIGRDITELKLAEDEIKALNIELEQRVAARTADLEAANKELESFSYSVSHDLRTPLRAIDGFSRILLDDYTDRLDDEGRRLLHVVRDNTSRMGQLIDDILKFSRTGRVELNFSETDMEKLVRDVFADLYPPGSAGNLHLDIEAIPAARCDASMMRQVFVNLLSNAVKFSRSNAASEIRVGAYTEGEETVYFVKDHGVGFDMQYAGKLFGVFQRLHGVSEFEGTGIGLAIVKRVVSRHGGRVWAEGKVGEGATIYFALPNKEAEHG